MKYKEGMEEIIIGVIDGEYETVRISLQKGIDVDTEYRGWTALRWGIQEGHIKVVELLINSGANIENRESQEGFSILDTAVGEGNLEIVQLLLTSGVDINGKTANGSVLHTAVAYDMYEMTKLLLANGSDLSIKDSEGLNSLEFAVKYSDPKTIDLLK